MKGRVGKGLVLFVHVSPTKTHWKFSRATQGDGDKAGE